MREAAAVLTRRDDICAHVAERGEPPVRREAGEAAESAPRDVLEEDPLNGIFGAEIEDL